jgi:hypothetical protein
MLYFKRYIDKSKCWWCGSKDLTSEHESKKTDLELLYGQVYTKENLLNHLKYKTESKGKNIQSSGSDRIKFEKNLCKICNGVKSQKFDFAYQKLIKYYYENRTEIKDSKTIDLEQIFGDNWESEYLNIERYIGKHVGCRMAENGFFPTSNLISFLDFKKLNNDLRVSFQIKPYLIGDDREPIDSIFIGPANPINNSIIKARNLVTSFSGWYTIANFTWNYLHENQISINRNPSKLLNIDLVNYSGLEGVQFAINEKTLMSDFSKILDKLENYPYEIGDRNLEHYNYMKNLKGEYFRKQCKP